MKKFIYIFGVIIINIFVFGALFKVQHWPGAGILITMGLGLFSAVFMPLAFIQSYNGNGKQYKQLYIAGFICAFITFTGAMFKIQHWPGAAWFLIVGIPLPFLYFLPVYVYYHNKSKEKSMLNFLGVMFMMVYVALFTAILALNVSRNVLTALSNNAEDISASTELLVVKNEMTYKHLENGASTQSKEKILALKARTETLYNFINSTELELVKAIENSDSKAIGGDNKIDFNALMAIDESSKSTRIMRGGDGISGKAAELKKQLNDYREFLITFVEKDSTRTGIIEALLTTSDVEVTRYGEKQTLLWEDDFFPNGTFLISILGNLGCVATNVKLAEGEALEQLAGR